MIIHCSKDFVRRFQIRTSTFPSLPAEHANANSWSSHVFKMGATPFVCFMHDASLWPMIIPVKGITKLDKLLPLFLPRVEETWKLHGSLFDSQNQVMVFLNRKNRSLIGSMNDAIQHIKMLGSELTISQLEEYLRRTPFSTIDYDSPKQRLMSVLGG